MRLKYKVRATAERQGDSSEAPVRYVSDSNEDQSMISRRQSLLDDIHFMGGVRLNGQHRSILGANGSFESGLVDSSIRPCQKRVKPSRYKGPASYTTTKAHHYIRELRTSHRPTVGPKSRETTTIQASITRTRQKERRRQSEDRRS